MMLLISGATVTVARLSQSCDRLGVLLTPDNGNSVASVVGTGLKWAVDNAAYSGFNSARFVSMLDRMQGADHSQLLFVTAPDVVGDALRTKAMYDNNGRHSWQPIIKGRYRYPVAYVLQDGQDKIGTPPEADAYFIGGTDDFKLSHASAELGAWAKKRSKWLHMGRVNSKRRLTAAFDMGCDSVDGSSMSKWSDAHLPKFLAWLEELRRQEVLYGWPEAEDREMTSV